MLSSLKLPAYSVKFGAIDWSLATVPEPITLKASQFLQQLKVQHQPEQITQLNYEYSIDDMRFLHNKSINLYKEALPVIASTLNAVLNTRLSDHYWSIRLYPILSSLTAILAERQKTLPLPNKSYDKYSLQSDVIRIGRYVDYLDAIQDIEFNPETNSSITNLLQKSSVNEVICDFIHNLDLLQKPLTSDYICMLLSSAYNKVSLHLVHILLYLLPFRKITLFSRGESLLYLSTYQDPQKLTRKTLRLPFLFPKYSFHIRNCNANKILFLDRISRAISLIDNLNILDTSILQLACCMLPYEIFDRSLLPPSKTVNLQLNKKISILSVVAHMCSPMFRGIISHLTQHKEVSLTTIEHGGSIPVAFEQAELELVFSRYRCVKYSTYHPRQIRLHHRHPRLDQYASIQGPLKRMLFILPSIQSFYYRSSSQYTPYSGAVTCCSALAIAENIYQSLDVRTTLRIKANADPINKSFSDLVLASPYVDLSNSRSIGTDISQSDLLVSFYPQTTVVDCFFSRKPFLIYADESCYQFHPRFNSVVSNLKEVGILHNDFSRLSAFIASMRHDALTTWWSSQTVQQALHELQRMCF